MAIGDLVQLPTDSNSNTVKVPSGTAAIALTLKQQSLTDGLQIQMSATGAAIRVTSVSGTGLYVDTNASGRGVYIEQNQVGNVNAPLQIESSGLRGVVVNVKTMLTGTNGGGGVFVNNKSTAPGIGLQVFDQNSARDQDLVRVVSTQSVARGNMLRVVGASPSSSATNVRMDAPSPQIQLVAKQYDLLNGFGKLSVSVPKGTGSSSKSSTLSGAVTATQTSIVVHDATGWPSTPPFLTWVEQEAMTVTAVNVGTSTFTVTRNAEGTANAAHADAVAIATGLTAPDVLAFNGMRLSNSALDPILIAQRPDSGGRVGIGFSTPTSPLTLSGRLHVALPSSSPGGVSTSGLNALAIDTDSDFSSDYVLTRRNSVTMLRATKYGSLRVSNSDLAAARDAGLLKAQGLVAENFSRTAAKTGNLLVDQVVYAGLVQLFRGEVISSLCIQVDVSGTSSLTGYAGLAIYDASLNLRASTSNLGLTVFNASGIRSAQLAVGTTPTPFSVDADGGYYLSLLTSGFSTLPTLLRSSGNKNQASVNSGLNPFVIKTAQTSFPAALGSSAGNQFFWIGCY
jgi:hypothetical protein